MRSTIHSVIITSYSVNTLTSILYFIYFTATAFTVINRPTEVLIYCCALLPIVTFTSLTVYITDIYSSHRTSPLPLLLLFGRRVILNIKVIVTSLCVYKNTVAIPTAACCAIARLIYLFIY